MRSPINVGGSTNLWTFWTPMRLWADIGLKTAEMIWACGPIMYYRIPLMLRAGPSASRSERRELVRMGQEKVEAAAESALAIGARAAAMNTQLVLAMMKPATWWWTLGAPAASASITRVMLQHQTAKNARKLSIAAAQITQAGLRPVRSRVARNRRRLKGR